LRQDHSANLLAVLQGFYAVEQFAPDYTSELIRLTRRSYGALAFSDALGGRGGEAFRVVAERAVVLRPPPPGVIEDYTAELRERAWRPPWDDPLRMLLYTVFQERATQVNYLNTAAIARGASDQPQVCKLTSTQCWRRSQPRSPPTRRPTTTSSSRGARMCLYYFPEDTLAALVDVLRQFAMPSMNLIPNYDVFVKELYNGKIYGSRQYARNVVRSALEGLGVTNVRRIEAGLRRCRLAPDENGEVRNGVPDGIDFPVLESTVRRLFDRVARYETEAGLSDIDPTSFVRNSWPGDG